MNASSVRGSSPRIRLLVLDVDGTVTDARHEVPETTRLAVQRVREAGVRVMLATGRRYRDALPVAATLGIDTPLVTASGALVKAPPTHATLYRAAFGPEVLDRVVGMIVAAGHEPVLYTDSYAEGFDFHCRQCDLLPAGEPARGLEEYLARNAGLARVQPDLHAAVPSGVFAGFAMGPQDDMHALEATLAATFPGQLSVHVIRSPRYRDWLCEIAPAGVTKWSGIMAVAREWGLGAAEICAVGDDVNDLPMIRAAGLGVAMGNAVAEVQAAADRVVGTSDASGMADVAELLLAGLA
ncbi:HAD-IIB family hydrolase [bacterium]|nr:HAD-IIB family hydrolase [bacterium]